MKAIDSTTTHATAIQRKSNAGPFFQPEETREAFFGSAEHHTPFFNPAPPAGNNPAPTTIQAKLTVGAPNDVYEQEADAMADKVVQRLAIGSNPSIQRKCAGCAKDDAEEGIAPKLQKKSIFESNEEPANGQAQRKCQACAAETIQPKRIQRAGEEEETELQQKVIQSKRIQRMGEEEESEVQEKPIQLMRIQRAGEEEEPDVQEKPVQLMRIQRMGGEEEEPALQAKGDVPGLQASSDLENRLNTTKGSGSPLPDDTRSSMESSFGADFSNVRVHTNNSAVQMNQELGAQAFTQGSDIYFNSGKYDTGSSDGQRLLAHELTHTMQQGKSQKTVRQKPLAIRQTIEGMTGGMPEEELALAQNLIQTDRAIIQRSTSWAAGAVHETINLAAMEFNGPTPITWHMLNGTKMATEGDAVGAMKSPTVSTYDSGGGAWKAKVTSVPLNTGSFDETVLSKGPWTKVVTKATMGARGLAACTGAGTTTFQAKGDPNDNSVYVANRRHEDHHASDHNAAFNDKIGTWDTKVTTAKNGGTEFAGANAGDATNNLWAAMGGTPDDAAKAYRLDGFARGGAFHLTVKGGPMSFANFQADKTCATSWAEVTNPS